MDKKRTSKEIIREYAGRPSSREGAGSFGKWILDGADAEGKDSALYDIWNGMVPDSEAVLPSADEVFKAAKDMDKETMARNGRRVLFRWIPVAAVFVAALLFFFFSRGPVTILASSDNDRSSFSLPDGSRVWLNRESRLRYRGRMNGRRRVVEVEGEVFFDVAKDARRPFTVRTDDMNITVLGTKFTVSAYPRRHVSAYLEEGSIKVKGKDFPETYLEPGQGISFNDSTLHWTKSTVNIANHTSWINPELVFSNETLGNIIENLEHRYNISIFCPDENLCKKVRLSMKIREESIDEVMDAIASLTGTSCSRNGYQFVIKP